MASEGRGQVVFKRAVRDNVPLLVGLAGGTGSGKTWSAMLLATGMSGGQPFAVIDTEAGRARHYADAFVFDHVDLLPPFRPQAYIDAIEAADAARYPVIIVDSMSHEWAGEGGILDWQDEEHRARGYSEQTRMSSWIKPKLAHKRLVSRLLQVRAHLILCFRAEPKVEMVRGQNGRVEVVEKQGPGGFRGWLPICEKNLPYELTISLLFMPEQPGVPIPMKLQEQHKAFIPTGIPITAEAGRLLAEWARGGTPAARRPTAARGRTEPPPAPPAEPAAPEPGPAAPGVDDADIGLVGDWRNDLMALMQELGVRPIDVADVIGQPFGMDAVEAYLRRERIHWSALVDRVSRRGAA